MGMDRILAAKVAQLRVTFKVNDLAKLTVAELEQRISKVSEEESNRWDRLPGEMSASDALYYDALSVLLYDLDMELSARDLARVGIRA